VLNIGQEINMHITEDYVELGSIGEDIMRPVTKILEETDWDGPEYDRNEVSLQGGKLLVLPYIIPFKKPSYTAAQVKLLQTISPIIETIMSFFPNYVKVRGELATLLPGVKVRLHYDDRWFHENCRRIHVPIVTNNYAEQHFEDRKYHLDYCKIYEINNRMLHGAANYGHDVRVHLILDILDKNLYDSHIVPDINRLNEIIVPEKFKK
jgi:hypothetical protein